MNKKSSKLKLDKVYDKLVLTIESCNTKEQLKGASRMVNNFKTVYKRVGYPKVLSYNLDRLLKIKSNNHGN
jgi:hypothetical protein